jgi:exodeoxyribonuclease VII small subunit
MTRSGSLWSGLLSFSTITVSPGTGLECLEEFALAKFEDCLQRLEKIVEELEKGEVPLEKSLTLFEEGMQLSAACRKELDEAEGKVEILLKQNGKLQAEPFEPLLEQSSGRN